MEPSTPLANLNFSVELKKVLDERNVLTTKTKRLVFDGLDEINKENIEDNRKRKKENALYEILTTEKSYIHQLEVIRKFFMKPVQEKGLLKQEEFEILFGNINTILSVNQELLHELSKGPNNVANAFSKIAPFFKLYSMYAFEFKERLDMLQNTQNSKFLKFLEMQETRPEVQSKLSALLIAPIQRVPRYKLLIQHLLYLTSSNDKDYPSLVDSLKKVEEAAFHINKVVEYQENMQKLLEFQRCLITGEPVFITPGRKLIKEGILMKISSKTGHSEKCYLVLMSDIMTCCKMKKDDLKPNSLKCSLIFPLNKCKVIEVLDKGCFKIVCQDEEIVLYHERLSETKEWIHEINESISQYLDDRKTLRKESTIRRPVKRKDLNEYNEVGLSPGRRLKKRRTLYLEEAKPVSVFKNLNPDSKNDLISPLLVTLKPGVSNNNAIQKRNLEHSPKNVFVFGTSQGNESFTFKCNKLLTGLGSTVKKFLGFK